MNLFGSGFIPIICYFHSETASGKGVILTESGDDILTESGNELITEQS